jgi:hypothetical protein
MDWRDRAAVTTTGETVTGSGTVTSGDTTTGPVTGIGEGRITVEENWAGDFMSWTNTVEEPAPNAQADDIKQATDTAERMTLVIRFLLIGSRNEKPALIARAGDRRSSAI